MILNRNKNIIKVTKLDNSQQSELSKVYLLCILIFVSSWILFFCENHTE